jgi:hypothetical protein
MERHGGELGPKLPIESEIGLRLDSEDQLFFVEMCLWRNLDLIWTVYRLVSSELPLPLNGDDSL